MFGQDKIHPGGDMREKEAREIIKRGQSWRLEKGETVTLEYVLEHSISIIQQWSGAEKYLEAMEKAEGLESVLEQLEWAGHDNDAHMNCCPLCGALNNEPGYKQEHEKDCILNNTLTQWKKDK